MAAFAAVLAMAFGLWLGIGRNKSGKLATADTPDASPESEIAITRREKEILDLISAGNSSKEIAQLLGISPKTVEFHRANLLKKYGARTSSQLVAIAG